MSQAVWDSIPMIHIGRIWWPKAHVSQPSKFSPFPPFPYFPSFPSQERVCVCMCVMGMCVMGMCVCVRFLGEISLFAWRVASFAHAV